MKVNPERILPSQDFLKPKTLTYILECIKNGNFDKLPPSSIVREDNNGNMIAIDGHNLISVRLLRKEDVDVHIAKSADDGLTVASEADIQRNLTLRDKFDTVLVDRDRLRAEGINTFNDLLVRYDSILKN